jgi:gliding motility-associated protein GldL
MGFIETLQTKKGKTFMGYLYGWGASIVIVGAMFKIQHWPGAGPMLVCGLSIEAVIFFFSAFEPVHEYDDWSLVYPELRGAHDGHGHAEKPKKDPIAQELDKLLQDAKIGPDLIESLGNGMKSLGEQASKLSDITDASIATEGYVQNVKGASDSIEKMSETYAKASDAMSSLANAQVDGVAYGEELQKVSKNLSALNAVYELQLQGSNEHMKATNKLYDGITELMQNLNESVTDTKRYKTEVGQLANNLTSLNTVYGNMLNAMKG